MSKKPKIDHEILSILEDYHLFIDADKHIAMPFCVTELDMNHVTSLKGTTPLFASVPLGDTVLDCEMREKSEFNYSFKILSNAISSRMLFRMDEGDGTHWNRHLPVPVDQQQVPTPHFHKIDDAGIEYAYRSELLEGQRAPLNIHDGFTVLCEECHIIDEHIEIRVQEEGNLPLVFEPELDPLKGVLFP